MKHVWHLIAADIRALRAPILAWVALVAIGAAVGAWIPALDMPRGVRALCEMLLGVLAVATTLLTLVVAVMTVQLHTVDSRAFWMSRPIPAVSVTISKVVLLSGVLVTWPAVVEMAIGLAYGVPVSTVAGIGLMTAVSQAVFVVPAVMVAAATTSIARYFFGLGGLVAALVATGLAIATWTVAIHDQPPMSPVTQTADSPVPVIVLSLLFMAAMAAGLLTAYTSRSRLRGSLVFAGGTAALFILGSSWPAASNTAFPQAPWVSERRPRLLPPLDAKATNHRLAGNRAGQDWRQVRSRLRISGVERSWSAYVSLQQATVETVTGGRLDSNGGGWAELTDADDDTNREGKAIREALGVDRLIDPAAGFPRRWETATILLARDADYRRVAQHADVSYRGTFLVFPQRFQIEHRLPLKVDASYQRDGYRVTVEEVSYLDGVATIELRHSIAWSPFDGPQRPDRRYYLVNRVAREALTGNPEGAGARPFWTHLPIAIGRSHVGLSVWRTRLSFPAGQPPDDLHFDERWLANGEISVVRLDSARAFERSIEIPRLSLTAGPTPPGKSEDR